MSIERRLKNISCKEYCYNVKKLIYVSELIIEPINLKKDALLRYEDYKVSDVAVNLLHNNLTINSNIFRKLFISRKNSSVIRLLYQDKIEQIFREYGYEIIYPEEMFFKDQLKTFSEAEFVAGASGAGFPFDIKRIYYITKVSQGVERGFHAHRKLHQVLICLNGSVKIKVKNPKEESELILDTHQLVCILVHIYEEKCMTLLFFVIF